MALLLFAAVAGLVVLTFLVFQPFVLALLWGAVLATVTHEGYDRLCRRVGGRRTLAAALMTVLVMLLVIGPFVFVSFVVVGETQELLSGATTERMLELEAHPYVQKTLRWLDRVIESPQPLRLDDLRKRLFAEIAPIVTDAAGYVFGVLATLFFILLSLFYLFRDGPELLASARELIPLHEEDRDAILGDIRLAVVASVRGGLVTALVQGFLGFVILFILGVGQPALWATVMAISSLVPLVGTAIVWLPMALFLFLEKELDKALILVGYGVLVIGMADNFLRPVLVGRHMEAHPLMLFFGILGGIAAFGFVGLVLGPVSVAFLNVAMRLLRREFRRVDAPAI